MGPPGNSLFCLFLPHEQDMHRFRELGCWNRWAAIFQPPTHGVCGSLITMSYVYLGLTNIKYLIKVKNRKRMKRVEVQVSVTSVVTL